MDARPEDTRNKRRRLIRVVFICGIVCWLLLWIASIRFTAGVTFLCKGGKSYYNFDVELGALHVWVYDSKPDAIPRIIWDKPERSYAFSPFEHDVNPLILAGPIGGFGGYGNYYGALFSVPFSFPLALWLLAGWMAHRKGWWVFFHSSLETPSDREKTVSCNLCIAMILIVGQMTFSSIAMIQYWKEDDTRACLLYMRNIQNAFAGYSGMKNMRAGDKIPWEEIYEWFKKGSHRQCPGCGEDYILESHKPRTWGPVIACPSEEHMKSLKTIDTSGWGW